MRLLSENDERQLKTYSRFVEFSHYKKRNDFARMINKSDFLVSLSRFESFSYVIAEALSCGLPIVATACDGPKALVHEKNGVLIPIDDLEAAHRNILWMIENHRGYDPQAIHDDLMDRFSLKKIKARIKKSFQEIAVDR